MKILDLENFLNESKSIQICKFSHSDTNFSFSGNTKKELYCKIVDWLYINGYKFENESIQRKLLTKEEVIKWIEKSANFVKRGISRMDLFHNVKGTDKYIVTNFIKEYQDLVFMLNDYGATNINFGEKSDKKEEHEDDFDPELEPVKSDEDDEPIEKIKISSKNPFKQAICVLGGSGAGKSYSIEIILNAEGHEFQFIIPTAATTGLLAQYSPRKKEYVPSRLSKLIIDAYENPQDLYTAVFDECHKSNVIEMINDELLQAISQRRNAGRRFISLDSDTAEQVFDGTDIEIGGNIQIPDNLGFIFISSNPRVIGGNPDFLNRVDLVEITEENRDGFKSSDDLIRSSLKEKSEKKELIEKLRAM